MIEDRPAKARKTTAIILAASAAMMMLGGAVVLVVLENTLIGGVLLGVGALDALVAVFMARGD